LDEVVEVDDDELVELEDIEDNDVYIPQFVFSLR